MIDQPDLRTPLCDSLGCRCPILQAGMGGVAGAIETVPSAAARIAEIVGSARATLKRLQRTGMAMV